ncbi:MAG: hypothetical protein K2K50_02990 [Anaeroplasmataceae bacterium]|nr:hypothetical protein [Anaeroplasmataceae bacterium]
MIRLRPGVYIWDPNLITLQTYIDGYLISLTINKIEDDFDKTFREYFNFWIQHRIRNDYRKNEVIYRDLQYNNARGYTTLISLIELDSNKQLELFFKYFDLFYEDYLKGIDFESIMRLYI